MAMLSAPPPTPCALAASQPEKPRLYARLVNDGVREDRREGRQAAPDMEIRRSHGDAGQALVLIRLQASASRVFVVVCGTEEK